MCVLAFCIQGQSHGGHRMRKGEERTREKEGKEKRECIDFIPSTSWISFFRRSSKSSLRFFIFLSYFCCISLRLLSWSCRSLVIFLSCSCFRFVTTSWCPSSTSFMSDFRFFCCFFTSDSKWTLANEGQNTREKRLTRDGGEEKREKGYEVTPRSLCSSFWSLREFSVSVFSSVTSFWCS